MLTWEQDLAYRRMLDLFYLTEKALPADRDELYGLLRATTKEQKAAVEHVLTRYWRKPAGRVKGFVQQKALKELRRYREKQAKRVKAANQRWLPLSKRNAHALQVDASTSYPILSTQEKRSPNHTLRQDHAVDAVSPNTHPPFPKGETKDEKRQRRTRAALKSAI